MRRWQMIAAAVAAVPAFAVAVTDAGGDTGSSSQPSITVNGSASQTIASGASDAQRQNAYSTALGDALTAAQAKAQFVASRESVTLGAVENVTEDSDVYPGFCGDVVEPVTASGVSAGSARPVSAPAVHKPKKKKKTHKASKPGASKAQVAVPPNDCPVQAQVTVTYLIAGPATTTASTTTTTTATTTTTST